MATNGEPRLAEIIRRTDPYLSRADIREKMEELKCLGVTAPEHLRYVTEKDLNLVFSPRKARELLKLCGEDKVKQKDEDDDFSTVMEHAALGFAFGAGKYLLQEIVDGIQSEETKKRTGSRKTEEKSVGELLLGAALSGLVGGACSGAAKALELAVEKSEI